MAIQGRRQEEKRTLKDKMAEKFRSVGGWIKNHSKGIVALAVVLVAAGVVTWATVSSIQGAGKDKTINSRNEQIEVLEGENNELSKELNQTEKDKATAEQGKEEAEKERDEVTAENEVLAGRLSKEQSKTLVNVLFSENPEILKTMQMDTVEFDVREKEDGKATTILKYTKENGTHVLYEIDMQIIDNADGLNQGEVLELGAGTYVLCSDLAGVSKTKYDRVVDKITDESALEAIKTGLAGEFNIDGETINPDEVYYNLKIVEGKQVLSLNYDGKEIKTISPESRVRENKIGEFFTNRYVKQAEKTIDR